jgi:hypothetical protein
MSRREMGSKVETQLAWEVGWYMKEVGRVLRRGSGKGTRKIL